MTNTIILIGCSPAIPTENQVTKMLTNYYAVMKADMIQFLHEFSVILASDLSKYNTQVSTN